MIRISSYKLEAMKPRRMNKMEFKIGQYVTIPSGEHIQIDEIRYCWERLYGVKEENRIEAVCYLVLNRGWNNKITIKDYQCTFYSDMADCAG